MRKRRQLLTRAKAARTTKPLVRGKVLNPPAATAAKYRATLERLVSEMTATTQREVEAFFRRPAAEKHFAQDESVAHAANRLVSALEKRFGALFGKRADSLAEWLVQSADKASSASLHASLKELSGGLSLPTKVLTGQLKDTMQALTDANAALIKSIPAEYLKNVGQAVMRSISTGNGLQDLQPYLEQQHGVAARRAKTIAEDQTRKAYGAINTKRMTALGLKQFEWVHSGGGLHPRELHQSYDGRVFNFANPPVIDERTGERGMPGDAPNCRCKAIPVVSAEEEAA